MRVKDLNLSLTPNLNYEAPSHTLSLFLTNLPIQPDHRVLDFLKTISV